MGGKVIIVYFYISVRIEFEGLVLTLDHFDVALLGKSLRTKKETDNNGK